MDNLNRSGRGSAPKHYDSESSSQNEDLGDEGASLRKYSDGTKGNSSSSGKQGEHDQKAPWMNARPQAPQPNTTSLDWVPPNPFAMDAPEDLTAPTEKTQTTLDNKPLVTTSTVTTTITAPVMPPASNLMTVVSRSPTKRAEPHNTATAHSIKKLDLTSITAPDPTETPKSSRTNRGPKSSSEMLKLDASKLRALGMGKTDMRLPEFENIGEFHIPKSDALAAQLVIADSKWFQIELTGTAAKTMLRTGVVMKKSTSNKKDEDAENVIKKFLNPFVEHHIQKSSIPKILEAIKANYEDTIADRIVAMHRKYADENKTATTRVTPFNDLPEVKAIMDPLIKPLIDALNGVAHGKESGGKKGEYESWMYSAYPAPILNLAIHLCAWTRKWGEANAAKSPELIKTAQMNALKAIVATRSFMASFTRDLPDRTESSNIAGDSSWNDYYTPLLNYMTSTVTKVMEMLINKLMSASEFEKKLLQSFAEIAESRAFRSDDEAAAKLAESGAKAKAKKPEKLMTRIRDALSPRGKDENSAPLRKPLKRAGTLNTRAPKEKEELTVSSKFSSTNNDTSAIFTEDSNREHKLVKGRERFMRNYFDRLKEDAFGGKIDKASFPEWSEILNAYIKKVSHGSKEDYQDFKAAPDHTFQTYLTDFVRNKIFRDQMPSDDLRVLQIFMEKRVSTTSAPSPSEKEKS